MNTVGGIETLTLCEANQPTPKEKEVLVQIKAISINPVDVKVRSIPGLVEMIMGTNPPVVLGWDIAGVVVATGQNATRFKEGDRVFGMINFPGHGKAYAEFTTAPEGHLALIPENVSFEEAAATTLAALTALQTLKPRVQPEQRILIHAGSGGVGHFAIQIAKHLGAYVITTSSSKNKDFVLSLGADEPIDYHKQPFEEVADNIDLVLDAMGGQVLEKSLQIVKRGGSVVSLPTPEFSEQAKTIAQQNNIDLSFVMVESNGEDMNIIKDWLAQGILKPHVSQSFLFNALPKAHEQIESGRTVGKIIVQV